MAEAQGPESLGDEEKPFEVDPELIDIEDDGGMASVPQEPQKTRGRPPKKRGDQNPGGQETRHRAFVESNVKTALAKTDMMEVMNRYDWDSGDYDVTIHRIQPQSWHGRNIQGYIAAFPHLIDEGFIFENFGGGVYDLKIRGPNPRQGGAAKGFLDGCRVKISGDPKLHPMDRSLAFADGGVVLHEPQAGPPSQRQIADIRAGRGGSAAAWEQPGAMQSPPARNPDEDPSLVKQSFSMLAERDRQSSKELAMMRERLINEAASKHTGDGMAKEALQLVKDSADRAIEAERLAAQRLQDSESKHREDVERMLERMNSQKTGIPPEMLQTLTEQHRSELATAHQAHVTQITQSQERHEREINLLRERYERELSVQQDRSQQATDQLRGDLQARLDRLEEQARREQERERERYQAEVTRINAEYRTEIAKLREEADRRVADLERDHKSRFDRAQDDWQRRLDAAQSTSVQERENLARGHQMQIEHLKALHDGQLSQERSQRDSLMAQIKAQHEASLKMMETSFTTQIDRLASELERTRSDLESTRSKVTEQGDLASQAEKLKRIGDSLGSVFGVGPNALAPVRGDDMDIEPRSQDEPKTWFGKLMQFANTDMGAGVWDFLKVAMASAAGGAYPPGSVPMVPMMPQQQVGYGPPGGYPGVPPGYGPTSYASPHSPYASGPMPHQQSPQPYASQGDIENPEDEYEEVEEEVEEGGEGEVQGSFVDDRQVEPAGPAPESPALRSPVRRDGVPAGSRPPAPVPVQAPNAQATPIPPEQAQQLRVLVKGLEDSMLGGANPVMMAQTISQMAPREQLQIFTGVPIERLIADVASIAPDSQLTSYGGRKFLATLQQHLKQLVG